MTSSQMISLALLTWDTNGIDVGKVAAIADSFRETGRQIQDVVLRPAENGSYKVVAGRHRVIAAKRLLWDDIRAVVLPYDTEAERLTAELIEIDENLCRRDLTPAQRAWAVQRRKAVYEKLHPETAHGGARRASRQIGDLKSERFTRATAEAAGKSERAIQRDAQRGAKLGPELLERLVGTSLDKGEELDALARLAPERREAIVERAASGEKVNVKLAVKREQRATREQALAQQLCALPDKRYGVIYADPEWRFEPRSRESGLDRAADNHYPTSPTAAIASREVGAIAAADSVLFLWATAPRLPDALTVMAAWGFAYKSHLVWHKQRPGAGRGTGYWFTGEHELLLVGTRGRLPAPATALCGSVVAAPVGAHSQKPACFAELIERAFPSLPKIELNARAVRPGWDAWGNEAESVVTESRANASDGMAARYVPPGAAAGGVSDDASRLAGGRTPVSTAAEWDAAQTSATGVTAGETAPLDLPDFLRRGADNRAPFMET